MSYSKDDCTKKNTWEDRYRVDFEEFASQMKKGQGILGRGRGCV